MPVPAGGDDLTTPDRLADLADLRALPGVPADLTDEQGWALIEAATAVVQAAAGQRILEVVDDEVTLYGGTDSLLVLPERPVTAITSVTYDGTPLAHGTNGASGMWCTGPGGIYRDCGWQAYPYVRPTPTFVIYTHGYPAGHQRLQLARQATLSIAKGAAVNPTGATRMAIDDYQEAYDRASAALEASAYLGSALRRQYGGRAGTVRIT